MQIAAAYLTAAATFLVMDLVWLGVVARNFYRAELGPLMADTINWPAGLAFYALFIAGLVVFVIHPALAAGSVKQAFVMGALFGLVAYATYDLTNLAVMRGFPWRMALVDMTWGAVATSVSAAVAVAVAGRM